MSKVFFFNAEESRLRKPQGYWRKNGAEYSGSSLSNAENASFSILCLLFLCLRSGVSGVLRLFLSLSLPLCTASYSFFVLRDGMDSSPQADIPTSTVVESLNRVVTVESVDGSRFTGRLVVVDEKSGNLELEEVRCQARDSSLSISERIFVRGSQIRLIQLPIELKAAPCLDWRKESLQLQLKKSLKRPRGKAPKKEKVKKVPDTKKRQHEKKLRKLRGPGVSR